MDWTAFLTQVAIAISPVLLAALTLASAYAAKLINAKVRNEYARGALLRLNDAAGTIVHETQQATIDDLKAASEDGRIDESELDEIKSNAIERVRTYLGKNGLRELERVFDRDAIETAIQSKIEAEVLRLKQRR
jgi:hypothetical protein